MILPLFTRKKGVILRMCPQKVTESCFTCNFCSSDVCHQLISNNQKENPKKCNLRTECLPCLFLTDAPKSLIVQTSRSYYTTHIIFYIHTCINCLNLYIFKKICFYFLFHLFSTLKIKLYTNPLPSLRAEVSSDSLSGQSATRGSFMGVLRHKIINLKVSKTYIILLYISLGKQNLLLIITNKKIKTSLTICS